MSAGDASLSVWEDSIPSLNAGHKARDVWELAFKRQVFARIVQTLRRLGWTVAQPPINPHDVKHYGAVLHGGPASATATAGELKGELEVSGRSITFKTWQA